MSRHQIEGTPGYKDRVKALYSINCPNLSGDTPYGDKTLKLAGAQVNEELITIAEELAREKPDVIVPATPASATVDGITWTDAFDDGELADKLLAAPGDKAKILASRTEAIAQIRATSALARASVLTTVPDVKIRIPSPPAGLAFFARELFMRLAAYYSDPDAKDQDFDFHAEDLSSKLYSVGNEGSLKEIYSHITGLKERKVAYDKRISEGASTKANDQIMSQLLSNQIDECVRVANQWQSASREASHDSPTYTLPKAKFTFKCTDAAKGVVWGLIREWRLTVGEKLPTAAELKTTEERVIKTQVPASVMAKARFVVRTKAAEVAAMALNLATVSSSKLNELGALCIKVDPDFKIKNTYDFSAWPVKVQEILRSAKTTLKGVNLAIAEYSKRVSSSAATAMDKAYASAVVKVPKDLIAKILTKLGVGSEAELPLRAKKAVVWCMAQAKPNEAIADFLNGVWTLDRFEEEKPKEAAKVSDSALLGLANKSKKEKKKQAKLKAFTTSSLAELWSSVYGVTKVMPAWVSEASLINEAFTKALVELKAIGEGLSTLKNHKDFAKYTYTTFEDFVYKFYKLDSTDTPSWVSDGANLEKIKEWLADGTLRRVYESIDKLTVKDPSDGSTAPMYIHNMADLRTQVSKVPKGSAKSEKGKKSQADKPKAPAGGNTGKSSADTGAKSRRAAKRAAKAAKASEQEEPRGRSRSRSRTDGGKAAKPAKSDRSKSASSRPSKSRSRSAPAGKRDSSKDRAKTYSEAAKRGNNRGRAAPASPRAKSKSPAPRARSASKSPAKPTSEKTPKPAIKGRQVVFDGVLYSVGKLSDSLAKNTDARQFTIGDGRFSRQYIQSVVGDPARRSLSTPFNAEGKIRAGWEKNSAGKFVYTGPKTAPPAKKTGGGIVKIA